MSCHASWHGVSPVISVENIFCASSSNVRRAVLQRVPDIPSVIHCSEFAHPETRTSCAVWADAHACESVRLVWFVHLENIEFAQSM